MKHLFSVSTKPAAGHPVKTPHEAVIEAVAEDPLLSVEKILPLRFAPIARAKLPLVFNQTLLPAKKDAYIVRTKGRLHSSQQRTALLGVHRSYALDNSTFISIDNRLWPRLSGYVLDLKIFLVR